MGCFIRIIVELIFKDLDCFGGKIIIEWEISKYRNIYFVKYILSLARRPGGLADFLRDTKGWEWNRAGSYESNSAERFNTFCSVRGFSI
jgi:hypothetical protein